MYVEVVMQPLESRPRHLIEKGISHTSSRFFASFIDALVPFSSIFGHIFDVFCPIMFLG